MNWGRKPDCQHFGPPDEHGTAHCRGLLPLRDDSHCSQCQADPAYAKRMLKIYADVAAGPSQPARSANPLPPCPHRGVRVEPEGQAKCAEPERHQCTKLNRPMTSCQCAKCPVGFRPLSVSVVIPTRDEGVELIETIRSCHDKRDGIDEVVVVWDSPKGRPDCLMKWRQDEDGIKRAVPDDPNVFDHPRMPSLRVYENDIPIGVDPSRNLGADASTGDVPIFLDAHMRISAQNLHELASAAFENNAIVQSASRGIGIDHTFLAFGADFGNDPEFPIMLKWRPDEKDQPEPLIPCEGLMGGCYAVPRHVWNHLGGFCHTTGLWGFSEEFLCMKAWFLDIPIYVHRDIHAMHWYRDPNERPYPLDPIETWLSRVRGCRVIFSEETFLGTFEPWLTARGLDAIVTDALSRTDLGEEHEAFQKAKRHSDDEFFETHPKVSI